MRGIKTENGRLILRPGGGFLLGTIADVVVGLGLFAVSVAAASRSSAAWLLPGCHPLAVAADGVGRLRVRVVADADHVQVRNKWRTRQVPLAQVRECRTEVVRWRIKAPWFVGRRPRFPFSAEPWLVGTMVTGHGELIRADALTGLPPRPASGSDPTIDVPVAMKIAALARWCSVPCVHAI